MNHLPLDISEKYWGLVCDITDRFILNSRGLNLVIKCLMSNVTKHLPLGRDRLAFSGFVVSFLSDKNAPVFNQVLMVCTILARPTSRFFLIFKKLSSLTAPLLVSEDIYLWSPNASLWNTNLVVGL